jgi:hypothetical protein
MEISQLTGIGIMASLTTMGVSTALPFGINHHIGHGTTWVALFNEHLFAQNTLHW